MSGLPRSAKRLELRKEWGSVKRDLFPFDGAIVVGPRGGNRQSVKATAQSYWQPLRLIIACTPSAEGVYLTNFLVGCDKHFARPVPVSFFADKIPTKADVMEADEWDDGGRVDYLTVDPGITVELVFENQGDEPVRIDAALLGLSSHSAFPWQSVAYARGDASVPQWAKPRRGEPVSG